MHLTIQNIKRRRVRTILTLLGVMIGVVAVVSLLSLGMGVKRELLQGYGDDASIRQITVQTPENNQNKKMLLTAGDLPGLGVDIGGHTHLFQIFQCLLPGLLLAALEDLHLI